MSNLTFERKLWINCLVNAVLVSATVLDLTLVTLGASLSYLGL